MKRLGVLAALAVLVVLAVGALVWPRSDRRPGEVLDEARMAGRDAASFPHASEDYFHDMDGAVSLTEDEVKGRNMWLVWTGGNDRFWDGMTRATFGAFDLLKIITSHPSQQYGRPTRWNTLGLVNEPCFDAPAGPDTARFNLWLDKRRPDCAPDPFENEEKYPGRRDRRPRQDRARRLLLRICAAACSGCGSSPIPISTRRHSSAGMRSATTPIRAYYNDPDLVRPYRVGMSCGFCHVGPSPTHPPADPENPALADLSSTVGAQYMWVDRLFVYDADTTDFMFQLVHTYRPGAMDTSLVSTDNINNPRTMNAIYNLGPRLDIARRWGSEKLAGGELNNKQFNDYLDSGPLTELFEGPDTSRTPHVLKDGADSVGALGALNRVYLNIGLFSEEWLLHFNAVVGGKPITPIPIEVAQKNSSYWQATEAGTPATALFFLKAARPDRLQDAPGGQTHLTADQAVLDRGKTVFADTCARCHSSKAPEPAKGIDPGGCAGSGYLQCFKDYWAWTQTDEYKEQMRAIVRAPDFLEGNYLSTELRIPVTLLRTNACSPLATNALEGNIWDNFSSQSYKQLPSVGTITVRDPFTGDPKPYEMPAGGRGYTRVALADQRLVDGAVPVEQHRGPVRSGSFGGGAGARLPGLHRAAAVAGEARAGQRARRQGARHDRPHDRAQPDHHPRRLRAGNPAAAAGAAEPLAAGALRHERRHHARADPEGHAGQPARQRAPPAGRARPAAGPRGRARALAVRPEGGPPDAARRCFRRRAARKIRRPEGAAPERSAKCPDFVVNRGHLFGTEAFNEQEHLSEDEKAFGTEPVLSDEDKRALIEFVKTF